MQQRSLGATGLKVSRLGLGTMTWGRDTDEHEARDQLIAFAEAGGTLVDTAAGYGDGASEELIGTLIGDVVARDEVVLATKAGIHRRTGARVTDTSRGSLLTTLDASLKRLGVDHVDLWQVHVWTDETPVEETLSALDLAVTSGRASYVGVSNYTGWQTAQAATWQRAVPGRVPLASTQVEYSLLNRHVEHEIVPAAQALGLGVLPWSPLGRGVLTGKYRTGTPSDSRAATEHFAGFVGRLPRRARPRDRGGRRARRRRSRLVAAGGLARVGTRPARGRRPDRRCPHGRAAQGSARHRGADPAAGDRRRPRRRVGRLNRTPSRREGETMARIQRRPPGRGVEWEFETLVLPKDFSRNVVTRVLVERAEHGGWELDRLRIGNDGKRRVVLRRKIIRQRLTLFAG